LVFIGIDKEGKDANISYQAPGTKKGNQPAFI
jgi:hypothetical protein